MDDLRETYHLRQCQENAYRDIRYPLNLRALHSKKYEYVVQRHGQYYTISVPG